MSFFIFKFQNSFPTIFSWEYLALFYSLKMIFDIIEFDQSILNVNTTFNIQSIHILPYNKNNFFRVHLKGTRARKYRQTMIFFNFFHMHTSHNKSFLTKLEFAKCLYL